MISFGWAMASHLSNVFPKMGGFASDRDDPPIYSNCEETR